MDFRTTTLEQLVSDLRTRRISARELTDAALLNIKQANTELNAFCAVRIDDARAQAGAIDERLARGDPVGPLAGIPLGVKDLEDASGYITTYGSDLHADDAPATGDSVLVARLKRAGCVVVGKTNTPEFGYKAVTDNPTFGFTRNPWKPDHTAGGSSGGSAAALAAGMVPLATGSDGGGSIRIPAAACGFTAMKASQGRVPLGGATAPGASVLGVRGPMTLRARDLALALDAVVGDESSDPFGLPHPGYSFRAALDSANLPAAVVWSPTMGFATVDAEIRAACGAFVERLADAGVTVIERERIWAEDPGSTWFVLWSTLRARAQGGLKDTPQWQRIDEGLRATIERGLAVSGVEFARALDAGHALNQGLEAAFAEAPFILTPTLSGQVPQRGAQGGTVDGEISSNWASLCAGINMTRNPAGTVCVGFTEAGLPIGLQVIGRQRDDLGVLKTMCFLEDIAALPHAAPHGVAAPHRSPPPTLP
jgi:aspartyl-tRNA(Asn)/glutamyl-tRNA(Gln) amidotransferase subunit A